ncbi:polymer-forming cytoskeletal protein [Fodinibius halophilus]|uniref:Polymer-forming cytoskeletal protein n=1 Tax=Fodinibius halophilus TaxID=1736908 RepID=A0A6M1TH20_9BACT|nr:polymer-forming cytoskeletal protein [Fodinibius halophilus]NGP90064.1 polymer-forming cytoskeletal protein [Fodinibius halophilus]
MSANMVFIEKGTSFTGTLTAPRVVVEGEVQGDILASKSVYIKSSGKVSGSIRTQKLLCEKGGTHNGFILLNEEASITDKTMSAIEKAGTKNPGQHAPKPVAAGAEERKNGKRLW